MDSLIHRVWRRHLQSRPLSSLGLAEAGDVSAAYLEAALRDPGAMREAARALHELRSPCADFDRLTRPERALLEAEAATVLRALRRYETATLVPVAGSPLRVVS